jgi:hypothetical protein
MYAYMCNVRWLFGNPYGYVSVVDASAGWVLPCCFVLHSMSNSVCMVLQQQSGMHATLVARVVLLLRLTASSRSFVTRLTRDAYFEVLDVWKVCYDHSVTMDQDLCTACSHVSCKGRCDAENEQHTASSSVLCLD